MHSSEHARMLTNLCRQVAQANERAHSHGSDPLCDEAREGLEDLIISILVRAPRPLDTELVDTIFQTGSSEIIAVLPHVSTPLYVNLANFDFLLSSCHPSYFTLAQSRGLNLKRYATRMMNQTAQNTEWRRTMLEDIAHTAEMSDTAFDPDILKSNFAAKDIILPIALAQIERFKAASCRHANQYLEYGRIYPAALLILAGISPAEIGSPKNPIGRKFLNALSSNHGMLTFHSSIGSLEDFIADPKAALRRVPALATLNFRL